MGMLNIDTQQANTLLTTFVNDHCQDKSNKLAVTYTIIGNLTNGRLSVMLVKQENLADTKVLFKTVCGQNVYSIQKHKSIDDSTISIVDNFSTYNPEQCDM